MNYFEKAIQGYKLNQTGERYLIAVLDKTDEIFQFEVLVKK